MALGNAGFILIMLLAIVDGLVVYVYNLHVFIKTSVPLKKAAGESVDDTAETLSGFGWFWSCPCSRGYFLLEASIMLDSYHIFLANLLSMDSWHSALISLVLPLGYNRYMERCFLYRVDCEQLVPDQAVLFIVRPTMGEVQDKMTSVDEARALSNLDVEYEPSPYEAMEPPSSWPSKGLSNI